MGSKGTGEEKSFKIAVSETTFGMRGIDYRSDISMTLVIAQSFDNRREANQGYNRVGRFGDNCKRVIFKDVDLVDITADKKYKATLFKFLCELK